ncbi:hypothetical protein J6590_077444 [Homalodisca vitripennis]|nr:hypothetical protein J6590_077444 [Homalodisca vitripennis]
MTESLRHACRVIGRTPAEEKWYRELGVPQGLPVISRRFSGVAANGPRVFRGASVLRRSLMTRTPLRRSSN